MDALGLFPFVSSFSYRGEIQIFWFVKLCFLASGKYHILTGTLLLPMHVSFCSKDNLVSLFFLESREVTSRIQGVGLFAIFLFCSRYECEGKGE